MHVTLISTYDLGRQPFGLASPAAWLRRAGATVSCIDLAVEPLREDDVRAADLIAFFVPMHTATKLAARLMERLRDLNPRAHLCFYGLYAPMNESYLRALGADTILGGEFEAGLLQLVERLDTQRNGRDEENTSLGGSSTPEANGQLEPVISLAKQRFLIPDRTQLPLLENYAQLMHPDGRSRFVGYTEASRGCKHLCRHCPVAPVYEGTFRIVQPDVVLADIRQQVAAGAEHITFGDADFFNGVGHAAAIVRALHEEFPTLTYDVTMKIEHLLKHARRLETLRQTGCAFITSAVEEVDDRILELLDKGHTRADFVRAVEICRRSGLTLSPTFVTFTPWTTMAGYLDILNLLLELDLVDQVAPIQLAMRLLIPAGSKLLDLPEVWALVDEFAPESLYYPWEHHAPEIDRLCRDIQALVKDAECEGLRRRQIFAQVWEMAHQAAGEPAAAPTKLLEAPADAAIAFLNEPWYC